MIIDHHWALRKQQSSTLAIRDEGESTCAVRCIIDPQWTVSVELRTRTTGLFAVEPAEESVERSPVPLPGTSSSSRLVGERLGALRGRRRELGARPACARPARRAEPLEHHFPLLVAVLHLQVVSCENGTLDYVRATDRRWTITVCSQWIGHQTCRRSGSIWLRSKSWGAATANWAAAGWTRRSGASRSLSPAPSDRTRRSRWRQRRRARAAGAGGCSRRRRRAAGRRAARASRRRTGRAGGGRATPCDAGRRAAAAYARDASGRPAAGTLP